MFPRARLWLLGLLGLLACCVVDAKYYTSKVATKDFLTRQKAIYNLLYHIGQPSEINPQLYKEGQEWDIKSNINSYLNKTAVTSFLDIYENGMLPRGELFSVYYPSMLREMEALYRLFYSANSFYVFYMTALWARNNVNEGQFFFALYNAVLTRTDTEFIQLPPPYEIYPYFFFNSEVLDKAHHAKTMGKLVKSGAEETYIIAANYSGWYMNREYNLENKLNYFTEDIGLNSYYFFFRQAPPFWISSEKSKDTPSYRGEEYLYGHKQLMNRYYLERLSNDLPTVEDFDWEKPFYPGYYPTMTYNNGLPFPQRPEKSNFPVYKYRYIKEISDKESRITAAIDSGYVLDKDMKWHNIYKEESANVLGNIIEGNADSCNHDFYGSIDILGRKILGYNPEPASKYQVVPSALEIFSTSMRDPAFYRLYKRICDYYYSYKLHQKPYTKNEIVYPNLKIESLTIDKLTTYFDEYDASIGNGLLVEDQKQAESMFVKVRQYRLNHKPFSFHLVIDSDKPVDAAIRIFLGPKFDSHHKAVELPENLKYFYEIDNWILHLNAGSNKIVRKSQDCFFVIPDQEPSEIFYKKLLKALDTEESFTYKERVFGFPERLLLPKGKKEGIPFQFFVYVSPVSSETEYKSRVFGDYKFDDKPFGFPLDKPIYDFKYDAPNMIFKDVLIYHKDEYDLNITY